MHDVMLLYSSENLVINWPEGAEDDIADEGKDIVELLLQHNPELRLGSSATGGQYSPGAVYMYMYNVQKNKGGGGE